MVDALILLTSLTLVFLTAIVAIALAKRTKIPLLLWMFVLGFAIGNILYNGAPIIQIPGEFLSVFSIIALLIVVFEATSKVRIASFDTSTKHAAFFYFIGLILNVIVLGSLARYFFGLQWFASFMFSVLVSSIEFSAIFPRHRAPQNKIMQLLHEESMLSNAIAVVVPFAVLIFLSAVHVPIQSILAILPFAVSFFAGIGAGLIVAMALFKLLHSESIEKMASVAVAAALLVAFVFAQHIDGHGLIAAATIGFIFGNIFVRQKSIIAEHLYALYSVLDVFVVLFAGIVVGLPFTSDFYELTLGLFIVYVILRLLASFVSLHGFSIAERMEIALFVPKGLTVAAIAFALLNYTFFGSVILVQVLLAFFVYSLVLDTVLDKVGFFKNR